MAGRAQIAVTADLHWGHSAVGDEASKCLFTFLRQAPPDLLILAGDIGTVHHFRGCLALFADLPCRKALVPGNHDIWVEEHDPRGDSLDLYERHLPAAAADLGFQFLDHGPLLLPQADLAVVGSMNWYDYSWALDRLQQEVPDWQERLSQKRFTRGRHNDGRFVRWPLDDCRFTSLVVSRFQRHLEEALCQFGRALAITHHPAFRGLSFPRPLSPGNLDALLWEAFSGNVALQSVLARHAERVPFVFSGHTHRGRENTLGPIRGFNIGGDYHFKRLLLLDWPAGDVQAHVFGDPASCGG
jgi:3',5'-cyclic AMP phosphodiesterase CpdA